VLDYINKGKQEAGWCTPGRGGLAEEGYYVGPHIFADVQPKAAIAQKKSSARLAVLRHRLGEALAIANAAPYALTGGSTPAARSTIAQVRAVSLGNLYIKPQTLVPCRPAAVRGSSYRVSARGGRSGLLVAVRAAADYTENTAGAALSPPAMSGETLRHRFARTAEIRCRHRLLRPSRCCACSPVFAQPPAE